MRYRCLRPAGITAIRTAALSLLTLFLCTQSLPAHAAGEVLADGRNDYLYDGDGRICAVKDLITGAMTGYIYDADGNRAAKGTISAWSCNPSANGFATTNDYILGPGGEQVTEMAVSGSTITWLHTNVWANGALIATDDVNKTHFYLNDWLGTRRVQTDNAGTLEQSCASLPYGDGETCGPAPTENLYTGKERDSESGNDYFGARYYASTVGRFLSPDWSAKEEPVPYAKLGDPQSLNLYEYVGNDPLGRVDADGHCCEWAQQKLQQAKQWVDTHPRTVSALKAAGTGALTVTAVVGVIVAAPVSVPAMVTASVVMMGAAGGAAATASYAAGAITGDTKNTDAAAAYVQTVANPAGLLTAVGTGGNMRVAGEVADVTDVVTGTADAVHPAASGAMGLATRLAGAATATNAAADLHRNTPPPPSNKTTPANQQR